MEYTTTVLVCVKLYCSNKARTTFFESAISDRTSSSGYKWVFIRHLLYDD